MSQFMHGILLLGGPGAGKGTQAVLLAKALHLPHISSGDLFREHRRNGTELGVLANSFIEQGQLVPDDVTINMVRARLLLPDCEHGFILDGFPRTIPQGDALNVMLADLHKSVTIVIHYHVRERMLLERLSHRWTVAIAVRCFHTSRCRRVRAAKRWSAPANFFDAPTTTR
jgi:adenylate kinase